MHTQHVFWAYSGVDDFKASVLILRWTPSSGHRGSQSVDIGQPKCLLCPRGRQTSPEWGEKSRVSEP